MTLTTKTFQSLDFRFALSTDDPALAHYVDGVFASLAVSGPAPAVHYTAWDARPGYTLRFGDHLVASAAGADKVVTLLIWHAGQQALAGVGPAAVVHAAAAVSDGAALVLPGLSGSGKTTLVAGLVSRGLGYLTDEFAVVEPANLVVRPFPTPLRLDGGWPEALAHLVKAESPFESDGTLAAPDALRPGCVAAPTPVSWLIFPSYAGPGQPRLTPLRRAEALGLLGDHWVNADAVGVGGFGLLARVVERSDCWRLQSGDLDATCDAVLAALARA